MAMMFLLFFFSVWGGGHAYIAWRLIRPLAPANPWRRRGWLLLACSLLIVPAALFGRFTRINPEFIDALAWVAYLDMGFFLVLVPLLVARDLGWLTFGLAGTLLRRINGSDSPVAPADTGRRRFLANGVNAGLFGLTGSMTAAGYYEARRLAAVRHITIPVAGLPDDLQDFHIVQLSDIHLGPTIKRDYLQGVVERTNELHPDLVAITGDLVDGFTYRMQDEVTPLLQLHSRHGTFFVTGNHEYYWGADAWTDLLRTMGLTVLINEHRRIRHGTGHLLLAGATDYSAGNYLPAHASDPLRARHNAARADVAILLAHQPKSAFAGAAAGYDLQLSGHIHGGQFFPWNLFIGLAQPFTTGLHRVRDRMWLYVSSGTGYWGPPQRLGVPSEITSIKLVRL